jgi:hypothetical protein
MNTTHKSPAKDAMGFGKKSFFRIKMGVLLSEQNSMH